MKENWRPHDRAKTADKITHFGGCLRRETRQKTEKKEERAKQDNIRSVNHAWPLLSFVSLMWSSVSLVPFQFLLKERIHTSAQAESCCFQWLTHFQSARSSKGPHFSVFTFRRSGILLSCHFIIFVYRTCLKRHSFCHQRGDFRLVLHPRRTSFCLFILMLKLNSFWFNSQTEYSEYCWNTTDLRVPLLRVESLGHYWTTYVGGQRRQRQEAKGKEKAATCIWLDLCFLNSHSPKIDFKNVN